MKGTWKCKNSSTNLHNTIKLIVTWQSLLYFSLFNCRTKGLFQWRRKTSSLEIENWAQNLGKSTTHSQLICWSPLKRCMLVMVWPVLPLPAWGPCPQQLPWPQQEWVSKICDSFWNSILGFRKRPLFVQSAKKKSNAIWLFFEMGHFLRVHAFSYVVIQYCKTNDDSLLLLFSKLV